MDGVNFGKEWGAVTGVFVGLEVSPKGKTRSLQGTVIEVVGAEIKMGAGPAQLVILNSLGLSSIRKNCDIRNWKKKRMVYFNYIFDYYLLLFILNFQVNKF
jgi:hypothetical protein